GLNANGTPAQRTDGKQRVDSLLRHHHGQVVCRQHDMLNCLGSDLVLGENCIEECSVRLRCRKKSDSLIDEIPHLSDFGAWQRSEDRNVVVEDDYSCAVRRNRYIAANDGEIGAALGKSLSALL